MMIPQGYPLMIETVTDDELLLVVGWSEDTNGDILPIVLSPEGGGPAVRLAAHLPYTVHGWRGAVTQ